MSNYNSNSNILVNKLNRNELKEFLDFLELFCLKYRESLNIPNNITFGIEIEYLGVNPKLVDFYINEILRDYSSTFEWASVREASIPFGGEINSAIMNDKWDDWKNIQNVCQFLKNNGAKSVVDAAGGHIHIGANIFLYDYNMWRKFFKLYTIFEDILYRFCYGDKINGRENIQFFAKPVGDILLSKMWRFNYAKNISDIKKIFPNDTRGYGLNLRHVDFEDISKSKGNTIEFRFPNATTEEVIWQNNINVLVKFLLAAFNTNISEDYLDSILKDMEYQLYAGIYKEDYQTIHFRKALLFADLIFDNTLDKLYFLKQYFKNFQDTKEKNLVLARRFII